MMRVAVVGAGVSGLGAAYLLGREHDVTLFDREPRAGGHVRTVRHGGLALDTGFLVHNGPNYPLLSRLYRELGVRVQSAEMSFSVSCGHCGLEWSGRRPFAQPRRAVDPRFLGLLREVVRWLRTARRSLDDADYESSTLEEYVLAEGYSSRFRSHYLVPLTSALWSTSPERALAFPAAYAIRFFERHGMLGLGRFRWRSVAGGAAGYVDALLARFPGETVLGLGVRSIARDASGVAVRTEDDDVRRFDKVVIATHADQALRLLEDPSDVEQRLLGAWRSTRNEVALHTDSRLLPRARAARSSWNYQVNGSAKPTITAGTRPRAIAYRAKNTQDSTSAGPRSFCRKKNARTSDMLMITGRISFQRGTRMCRSQGCAGAGCSENSRRNSSRPAKCAASANTTSRRMTSTG